MEKILNKIKSRIWEILIIVGASPFIYMILSGIYNAVLGFSGVCITGCMDRTGFDAFMDWAILFTFAYWPIFIVGIVLIIIGIIMVERKIDKERMNID